MTNRKRTKATNIEFGSQGQNPSLLEWDQALFGQIAQIDHANEKIEYISIFNIVPDPTQPRRALPSWLRDYSVPEVFSVWMERVTEFVPLVEAILNGQDFDRPDHISAEVSPLTEIAELAASIRFEDLVNPVTVVRQGNNYQLETGERRWMAYHLLHLWTEDQQWSKIPARVKEAFNRWRQAIENTAREDLNAIGRTRQFAILLMDLYGPENFKPFDAFDHEQDFYAQVADEKKFRIPHGKSEALLRAMGLQHRNAFMRCRKLLNLSPAVWQQGDDENWPEDRLLKFVTTRDNLDNSDIPNQSQASPTPSQVPIPNALFSPEISHQFKKMLTLGVKAGQGDRRARDKFLSQIAEHRQWIDAVEQAVRDAAD